jgi:predicted nuclease of predicted toxin-antitoxin system
MSIKLLIDMNLSPQWVEAFKREGWQAIHWSTVGAPNAADCVIMEWARANGYVVFTHDLDFGTALALTRAEGPSVIQVRAEDVLPDHLGDIIFKALRQYQAHLEAGALIVVDESTYRVRILLFDQ